MTASGISLHGESFPKSPSSKLSCSGQLPLAFGYRPTLGREDFLVAPCNQQAVALLDRWPEWTASGLMIYGPAGCGKTHLAHVWQTRSQAVVLSPSAVRDGDPPELLRSRTAVVIEDTDRIVGTATSERTLLHIYNMLSERQGSLLLTAMIPIAEWSVDLPDLRSRLATLPAVGVGVPDDALIGAVLVKMFSDRQLQVNQDVIAYLLARMERSFAAARRIVAVLDTEALAAKRRITVPFVARMLDGL